VTHFYFEGCKYWAPLYSDGQDIHWNHPNWITDDAAGEAATGRVRDLVQQFLPEGSTVLVASRGDEALVSIEGRHGWHFPRDEHGVWPGYYPADGAEAIEHLEDLRARGAQYLVLPETAFWWLDHYGELAQFLDRRCDRVLSDESCVIYALPPA
jgi:hypothetical protein